jgi:hypothetical protein
MDSARCFDRPDRFPPLVRVSILVVMVLASSSSAADPGTEFFEKKIRPVLVEHCYECHSAEAKKPKGGLLLDTRAGMLKGGDSGPALVPRKPKDSLILKAVHYSEEGLRMPPSGKLPAGIIADLENWVAMGAPDPRTTTASSSTAKSLDLQAARRFWAFQPPRRQPAAPVKRADWPRNDIDRFILAKLEANGLHPSADADRGTLLRRAYFDLIGLPPTPEQVDAFMKDESTGAFAKVIDELLASPHFGERWGRHWLDVARFAESSGGGRSLLFKDAWRYRDYVIESFNTNKPYNRFVVEQIAGDLMPASTPDERRRQLTATTFLALGPTNYERQDKDALEMDVVDEQLDTMGRAFLGMTIGCARCHDHKFDPIPTRDYYALAGILHSSQTLIHDNVSRWVEQPLPMTPRQEAALRKFEGEVAALKEQIKLAKAVEQKAGKLVASTAKGVIAAADLPGVVWDDSQAKKVGEWTRSKYSGTYIGDGYLHDGNADKGKKTLTFVPELPRSGRYDVRLAYSAGSNRAAKVPVHILHLDGEFSGFVNEQEDPSIDGRFVSLGTFRFDKSGQWYVIISNENTAGHVVVDAVQFLPEEMLEAKPAVDRKQTDSKKLEAELKKLTDNGPSRPMAMSVREGNRIEDCAICIRGSILNRGEKVPRGFLQVATMGQPPAIPAGESGRRQLGEWLASSHNPLTARVMVNRIWHYLFGAGLVRTVDVFGTTGEPPSHPELLDHLVIEFMDNGWSVKQLIRKIMLSRTYQQSSTIPPEHRNADPENRWLGHMNRRRLDAEAIRDSILSVSGRLDRSLGGPNVKKGTTNEYQYQFDDTRRSVYTPVLRNRLLELFEVFDFADPNLVGGRRNVSTVATQALYLTNSPFVMEQARHAARKALAAPIRSDAERVARVYREALGRLPTDREQQLAMKFIATAAGTEERLQAWAGFYQALFGCIDFRYVD